MDSKCCSSISGRGQITMRLGVAADSREFLSDTSFRDERSITSSPDLSSPPTSVTSIDDQNNDGNLLQTETRPLRSNHERLFCPFFPITNCNIRFVTDDFDLWHTHSISHFGNHSPPSNSICMFCDTTFQNEDPWRCWRERMHHIADHFEKGIPIEHARPDFALLSHLREKSLVSNNQYENTIRSQEEISIEGLRPLHYVPEQITVRSYEKTSNWVIDDLEKEGRIARRNGKTRRLSRREGNGKSHIALSSLSRHFEKLPEQPVTPVPASGFHEVDESDTDISIDDGLSDISPSIESDNLLLPQRNLPLDIDQDEDLIDPTRHRQRLKSIRDKAFRNSSTFRFDYKSRVVVNDIRTQTPDISDKYVECREVLRRIRQNILMLMKSGFCQKQISFLKIDPRRLNVALLVAIPVDSILQLGLAFEQMQDSFHSGLIKLAVEKSFETESSGVIGENPLTKNPVISSPPRTSDQPRKDFQRIECAGAEILRPGDNNFDHEPKFRLLRVHDPAKVPSLSRDPIPLALYGQSTLEDWPLHGCLIASNGPVVVFNHAKRHSDRSEPRSAEHTVKDVQKCRRENYHNRSKLHSKKLPSSVLADDEPLWDVLSNECNDLLLLIQMSLSDRSVRSKVYTVLRMIDLIILSYAGAHVENIDNSTARIGPHRQNFRLAGSDVSRIRKPCKPQKGTVTLGRRELRCLKGFFAKRKIWVFHEETVDARSDTSLLLSATPEDFADIWGPMWRINGHEKNSDILRYDLENGSIISSRDSQISVDTDYIVEDEEALCHWISNSDLRKSEVFPSDSSIATFVAKPKLLIGAAEKVSLRENKEICECTAAKVTLQLRDQKFLAPPGTSTDRRTIDTITMSGGMTGGVIPIQVGVAATSKVTPGRTLKESLIKRWTNDKCKRNPYVLLELQGVEVSFCTSNSRKVRLVDLLSTKTMTLLIQATDPIKDPVCKVAVSEAIRTEPEKIVDMYLDNPAWRDDIGSLLICCLDTLFDTGTTQDINKRLSIFWMYDRKEYIVTYPLGDYKWEGFIRDSDKCCCFAVLEQKCLIFDAGNIGYGCQNSPKRRNHFLLQELKLKSHGDVFETSILINRKLELPPGLKRRKNSRGVRYWKIDKVAIVGAAFPMGERGTLVVVEALPDSKLLVNFVPQNRFKAAFTGIMSSVGLKGPEYPHWEFLGEMAEGDYPPIGVFIIG